MRMLSLVTTLALTLLSMPVAVRAEEVMDIGSRRELFVDRLLVDEIAGDAELHLHKPRPREVVLVTDEPWEGNICAYYTIFQDGEVYRMYYRGAHAKRVGKGSTHPEVVCYAQSKDGIHWTKPELGLFEFNGSKRNNIVWRGVGSHNFAPFVDRNSDCDPRQRYKAVGGSASEGGLHGFVSDDGLRWSLLRDTPLFPSKRGLDSQNVAFWDGERNTYRLYYRTNETVRRISTATSPDLVNWSPGRQLAYSPGTPLEHLYTNAIMPYERAPHLLIGFPTRYLPKTQQVEPLLMSSRDGQVFHRWREAVIPIDATEDRDQNRSNYMAWGLVRLPSEPNACSVYATEAYYSGPDSRLRRFTYRVDGFVSLRAGADGGELITKPLIFAGSALRLNYSTSGDGTVRAALLDVAGKPLPGFTLADCRPLHGDALDSVVRFAGGSLSSLAGKSTRVRFVLANADVFSYRFE